MALHRWLRLRRVRREVLREAAVRGRSDCAGIKGDR